MKVNVKVCDQSLGRASHVLYLVTIFQRDVGWKTCTSTFSLADLHTKFSGARPRLWDPILSFSHTFSLKSALDGGPRPPMGPRPLREILDPPLFLIAKPNKTIVLFE